VRTTAQLKNGDTIRIDVGQILRCNFSERIIEEERNIIRTLERMKSRIVLAKARLVWRAFHLASRVASLSVRYGASGSGKSTL